MIINPKDLREIRNGITKINEQPKLKIIKEVRPTENREEILREKIRFLV